MRNFWLATLTALVGCSSSEPLPPPDVHLLVGQESETWSADPPPTHVTIELVTDTQRTLIGEGNAPASVVTLHDPGIATGTIGSFEATGVDAAGTPLVRGTSVPFLINSLGSASVPIFVGRASTWARPAQNMEHARNHPVTTVAWNQYVIAVGGETSTVTPATPDVYDVSTWQSLTNQPAFPCEPKSMLLVEMSLLCINDTGAMWVEFGDDLRPPPTAPAGFSFAEVAGGEVYVLPDGSSYVVGATRTSGDPTARVLRVDATGGLRAISLGTPRRGAAAGVVAGNLVVWGGSGEGPAAETLNSKTQDAFTALSFPPDASVGLSLATFDGTTVLLAGGEDPVTGTAAPLRLFDVACTANCAAAEMTMAPVALQRTHVFPLAAASFLITGDSDDGEFHAFNLATGSSGMPEITERPLRDRRKGATALLLPNGQPGVIGGQDPETGAAVLSLETFFF